MRQEHWQQIRDIFDGAIEHAPDERSRFLDEVCANDEEVRREVEDARLDPLRGDPRFDELVRRVGFPR